jgi:hypothetical protein
MCYKKETGNFKIIISIICLIFLVDRSFAQNVTRKIKWIGNENNPASNQLARSEKEQLLISRLLKTYNNKQKPPGTVNVKMAMNLNQIINVIEKDQVFVLNVFLDHEW